MATWDVFASIFLTVALYSSIFPTKTSEQDVRAMMQQGDTNRDGFLSIEEFLGMNTKNMEFRGLENVLKNAFEALDVDGDDIVTAEEINS
ncbi:hypothetical protein CerSpe_159640 [Prunus speciosa]